MNELLKTLRADMGKKTLEVAPILREVNKRAVSLARSEGRAVNDDDVIFFMNEVSKDNYIPNDILMKYMDVSEVLTGDMLKEEVTRIIKRDTDRRLTSVIESVSSLLTLDNYIFDVVELNTEVRNILASGV